MKIGIMTFHASNNCGSMLQAYALQNILKKELGEESEIINFSNENQQDMYALFRKMDSFKDVGINIATSVFYNKFKKHYKDYKKFMNKDLKLSEASYVTSEELKNMTEKYDILITGSDQVWNIKCKDADDAYYLNFAKNVKKIAYAPSFGATNIIEESDDTEKYKNYMMDFKALSCRENNGSKWIKKLTGRDAPVLLDPTLLLNSSEWDKLINTAESDKKYIFYYAFKYSDEVNAKVKMISEKTKMPVIIMDVKWWLKKGIKNGFKISKDGGPLEFLRLVRNASLVLTTSFHGTVFSIIYNKKFWFLDSSMHNKNDDRAFTLLESVGLENRMVDVKNADNIDIMKEIDYSEPNKKLQKLQQKSINYLKENIKDEEE